MLLGTITNHLIYKEGVYVYTKQKTNYISCMNKFQILPKFVAEKCRDQS